MTENSVQRRAELLRDYPVFWFCVVYAINFFGASVAIDLRSFLLGPGTDPSAGWRYRFPLAFPTWLWFALRGRAGRMPTTGGEPVKSPSAADS